MLRSSRRPALATLALVMCLAALAPAGEVAPADPPASAAVAKKLGFELVTSGHDFPVKTAHGEIAGTDAPADALAKYDALFAQEFADYPRALIQRARLRRVVLCVDLSFAGTRREAIPDFEHDTLYLDVGPAATHETYARKVVHHEFFHILDYRDDGHVYTDARWAALNPKTFEYGDGGESARDTPTTSVLTEKYPGFLNHYSTTGVEEDKAEVFANLMVDPGYVHRRTRTDRVLAAKVKRMEQLLAAFCPELDAKFWRAVQARYRARVKDEVERRKREAEKGEAPEEDEKGDSAGDSARRRPPRRVTPRASRRAPRPLRP